uniref:Uncharacterized protein n=1 Tax=Lactuca sativa TaxID=4236 RepID=A0A9R1X612_LACSA|nr:hypothetical protein LSAT_V11C600299820 [Lactuca sativa]
MIKSQEDCSSATTAKAILVWKVLDGTDRIGQEVKFEVEYINLIDIDDQYEVQLSVFSNGLSKENGNEDNCSIRSNMSMEMEDGINITDFLSTMKSNME